ncbi:hypothetical protein C7M61_002255 [Candidozyma pseudohaemuli]|uniref:Uncharacterized protein n=1 Tax=Candidozyma pseudohaemuli TaxID=418784 RepID=A0A2P7YSN7_9ASCO|nr:hypothetical protein C7M61_002255 [[Candida] pseudohaemulonii]PSK38949.1 hypothetical protein C7M61_002255 [[Candida] pseudohaemulonii]
MTSNCLYFIEPNDSTKPLNLAARAEIERDPANYVSHESHTFMVNQRAWTASVLNLKRLNVTYDLTIVEDDVSELGKSPDFEDGQGRVVSSFMRLKQLEMYPLTVPESSSKETLIALRCLQIGGAKIPLDLRIRTNSENRSDAVKPHGKNCERSISMEPVATYIPPQGYRLVLRCNFMKSGSSLSDFLSVGFQRRGTSLCKCDATILLSHITVTLEEHTSLKVQKGGVIEVIEKTRSHTLKDSDITYYFSAWQFENAGEGYVLHPPASLYNCNLPQLGPTFHSNYRSRTYQIRIDLDVECTLWEFPCSERLSTTLNIDIGAEANLIPGAASNEFTKVQDLVYFEKYALAPDALDQILESTLLKAKMMKSCFGYQTSVVSEADTLFAISTFFVTERPKKLWLSEVLIKEEDGTEYSLTFFNDHWRTKTESGSHSNLNLSFEVPNCMKILNSFLAPKIKEQDEYLEATLSHRGTSVANPGMICKPCMTITMRIPKSFVVKNVPLFKFYFTEQLFYLTQAGQAIHHRQHRDFDSGRAKRASNTLTMIGGKMVCTPFDPIERIKIPDVAPSLHSSTLHRCYKLYVTGSNPSQAMSLCLDTVFGIADDKNSIAGTSA